MTTYKVKTINLVQNLQGGHPTPDIFKIVESEVNSNDVQQGGVLLQILCISADPYLRSKIRNTGSLDNNSIQAGGPMSGFVSGKVLISRNENWKENDLFGAALPFSTFMIIPAEQIRGYSNFNSLC